MNMPLMYLTRAYEEMLQRINSMVVQGYSEEALQEIDNLRSVQNQVNGFLESLEAKAAGFLEPVPDAASNGDLETDVLRLLAALPSTDDVAKQ